jgi:hypothetical protein
MDGDGLIGFAEESNAWLQGRVRINVPFNTNITADAPRRSQVAHN